MPQLNPDPWLSILGTAWLVYMVLQPKIKSHTHTNTMTSSLKPTMKKTWIWPWT